MQANKLLCIATVGPLLFALTSCGWRRDHLTQAYGESFRASFAAQHQTKEAASAVTGLDSQEAAIISDAYRASLIPKGVKSAEEPLILVAPPSRERQQPLAPSVPKEK